MINIKINDKEYELMGIELKTGDYGKYDTMDLCYGINNKLIGDVHIRLKNRFWEVDKRVY